VPRAPALFKDVSRKTTKMKYFLLALSFVIIAGSINSCQAQAPNTYADALGECLEYQDIQLLNSLTTNFENHIKSIYKTNTKDAYKKYLQEVATMNLPDDFFRYSTFASDVKRLRESPFYNKAWSKSSQLDISDEIILPLTNMDEISMGEDSDFIVFNANGEYFQCVGLKNKNKIIKDYIIAIRAENDINPAFLAKQLHEGLISKDYDEAIVRLVIAINFHHYFGLMLLEE
jgi:hypothetical protein